MTDTFAPIVPAIRWATAHDHVMSVLDDHGLSGLVYDADSPHPCDVRLNVPRHHSAAAVVALLSGALDRKAYAVIGPECGTVTVGIRTGKSDIMGSSGLVHRVDAASAYSDTHTVARRIESVK